MVSKDGKAQVVTNITKASSKSHAIKKTKVDKKLDKKAIAALKNRKDAKSKKSTKNGAKKDSKKAKGSNKEKKAAGDGDDTVVKMTKKELAALMELHKKEVIATMMKGGKK